MVSFFTFLFRNPVKSTTIVIHNPDSSYEGILDQMEGELIQKEGVTKRRSRSVKGRNEELQALAMEKLEERLRDGTATAAEIIYMVKLTSRKSQLELENLEMQNKLLRAKTIAIESEHDAAQAYRDAMKAFAGYLPSSDE